MVAMGELGRLDIPIEPPKVCTWLGNQKDAVVLELPVAEPDAVGLSIDPFYMYYSTFHWQRLLNGYSGFLPRSYTFLLGILTTFPSDRSIDEIRYRKVDCILVHENIDYWGLRAPGNLQALVDARKDLRPVVTLQGPRGLTRVYELVR